MKTKMILLASVLTSVFAMASEMPKLDVKKFSQDQRAEKCADWAKDSVNGDKKKSADYKEAFQKCLTKNGLPSSLAFNSKYKL